MDQPTKTYTVRVSCPRSGLSIVLEPELAALLGGVQRWAFDRVEEDVYVIRAPKAGDRHFGVTLHKNSSGGADAHRLFMNGIIPEDGVLYGMGEAEAWLDEGRLYIARPDTRKPPKHVLGRVHGSGGTRQRAIPTVQQVDAPAPVPARPRCPSVVLAPATELVLLSVGGRTMEFRVPLGELFDQATAWTAAGYRVAA